MRRFFFFPPDCLLLLLLRRNPPTDLDSFAQQMGRAGRDGRPAECVLYTSRADLDECTRLARGSASGGRERDDGGGADGMCAYVLDAACRREALLQHFGFGEGCARFFLSLLWWPTNSDR